MPAPHTPRHRRPSFCFGVLVAGRTASEACTLPFAIEMNFLAHFHLADAGSELLAGSFLGDFCKGGIEKFPEVFRAGIRHHREVDGWVEGSEGVRRSRRLLAATVGRYAPVALDILHDHFLANVWLRFSSEPLSTSVDRYYAALRAHRGGMPDPAARVADRMIELDWLRSYLNLDEIRVALERTSKRLRYDARLDSAVDAMPRIGRELEADFLEMFGALKSELGVSNEQ